MHRHGRPSNTLPALALGCCAAVALWLGACSNGGGTLGGSSGPRLSPQDFVARDTAEETRTVRAPENDRSVRRIGPVEASGGIGDVRVIVGDASQAAAMSAPPPTTSAPQPEPGTAPPPPPRVARERTEAPIDSMVGQINGRPVFASEFLRPMESRLRAEARTMSNPEWMRSAQRQIRSALLERMRDEILLAEFEASLDQQQRMGVLAFVQDLRDNLIRENFGSEELARRRLLEEEGMTLDEKIRAQRDRELIRAQVRRALGDRAYVSWREVRQQFERDVERYTPSAQAVFRMIQTPTRDAARIERVRAALAAGESFEAVATRESDFNPTGGGRYEITVSTPTLEEAVIFRDAVLNEQARSLEVGGVAGPFAWNDATVWLTLETFDRPPPRSLYEEQLAIFAELRSRRLSEEEFRYFTGLLQRSNVSDVDVMEQRLLAIAARRFLGDGGR